MTSGGYRFISAYNNFRYSSTVIPEARINARSVPTDSFDSHAFFYQHQMASNLPYVPPSGFAERLGGLFAGNIRESAQC